MSKLKNVLKICSKFFIGCILVFSLVGCPGGDKPNITPSSPVPTSSVSVSQGVAKPIETVGNATVTGIVTKEGIISASGLTTAEEKSSFPVADAPVYLDDIPTIKAKSDDKGYFELKGVPKGDHYVVSEIVESGTKTLKNRKLVTIAQDAQVMDIGSFVLKKTGSISGKVSGVDTNDSTLGIDVFIPGSSMIAKTKSTGAYGIINVAEGKYRVAVSKFGYENAEQFVTVESGKPANLDFTLTKIDPTKNLAKITGKVVTKTSLGIEGLSGVSLSISGKNYVTMSDTKGEFVLANIEKGTYKLQIFRTGYIGLEQEVTVEPSKTKDISLKEISLEPDTKNGIISGIVTSETNEPLGEVTVKLGAEFVLTDSNGAYIFDNVKPGNWSLKFQKEGYKQIEENAENIKAKETFKKNIILKKEDFIGYIAGKVVDTGDNFVPTANIDISETGETKFTNSKDGTFKISNVKAGTYTLLVAKDLWGYANFRVEVKDKNIEGIVVTLYIKLNPNTDKDSDGINNGSDTWPYDKSNDSVLPLYPLDPIGDEDGDTIKNCEDLYPFDPTNDSLDGGVNINTNCPKINSSTPTPIASASTSGALAIPIKNFYWDTTTVDTVKVGAKILLYANIEYDTATYVGVIPTDLLTGGIDKSNKNIDWKSLDETVATVDSLGYVTGVKAGTATITATATGNISADKKTITKQITVSL